MEWLGRISRACLRYRVIQALGTKAENLACPPIYRDELRSRRLRLLTEVLIQSFAKLQPTSP